MVLLSYQYVSVSWKRRRHNWISEILYWHWDRWGGGEGGLYCNSNKGVGVQMKEGRVVSHRVSHGVHYRLWQGIGRSLYWNPVPLKFLRYCIYRILLEQNGSTNIWIKITGRRGTKTPASFPGLSPISKGKVLGTRLRRHQTEWDLFKISPKVFKFVILNPTPVPKSCRPCTIKKF